MAQVVAISVFLALGFAFYVFFVPFVGGDEVQYVVVGLYTPLVSSSLGLFGVSQATFAVVRFFFIVLRSVFPSAVALCVLLRYFVFFFFEKTHTHTTISIRIHYAID